MVVIRILLINIDKSFIMWLYVILIGELEEKIWMGIFNLILILFICIIIVILVILVEKNFFFDGKVCCFV